jgi:hypothetical protein
LVGALVGVNVAVTNGLYDIAVPGLQASILSRAPPGEFVTDRTSISQWDKLRSAVLETLRLCARFWACPGNYGRRLQGREQPTASSAQRKRGCC